MLDRTPVLVDAKVTEAANVLRSCILAVRTPRDIAIARAIYTVLSSQWSTQPRRVLDAFGPSDGLSIQDWHNDAVRRAYAIVAWETTSETANNAYIKRRQNYESYVDGFANQFDRFQATYKQLAPSISVPRFSNTDLTPAYVSMLKKEVLAWYDRQRPSEYLVRPNPQDGMVRFMNQRKETIIMLETCHAKDNPGSIRQAASDACTIQLALAPILGLMVGLYKTWDGTSILQLKDLSELERAVLAVSMFVPAAARIIKAGRLVYTPERLAQMYGGDPGVWKQAISCAAALAQHRPWQRTLDEVYATMLSGAKLSDKVLADATTALPQLVSALRTGSQAPILLEPEVTQLWASLQSKHDWLGSALLDEYAFRRVLLMGPNLGQLQAQLLAELSESRIATLLRDRNALYILGIEVPEGCTLEFVPGHAFRAGDKNPDIANRQITDGVLGYWQKDVFCVAAVLEIRVDGVGGRELGFAETDSSKLTESQQDELRAFSNREWDEAREVSERRGEKFNQAIAAYDPEILKFDTGSQLVRDIDRLDNLDEVRINGVLSRFQLLPTQDVLQATKILAVVPRSTEPESEFTQEVVALNSIRQTPFLFEVFAVPITVAQLKQVAEESASQANSMVNTAGKAVKATKGPCPDVPVPHPPLLIQSSVHPAVREAQRKLNAFHAYRVTASLPGLRSAPLEENCVFDKRMFDAVKSFQELVFPGNTRQQDGKIASSTWAQLDIIDLPVAKVTFDQTRFGLGDDGFTKLLSWDEVTGLHTTNLNIELVASGLPPATMPPKISVELTSRVPNGAGGTSSIDPAKPVSLDLDQVGPDKAKPTHIIYRITRAIPSIGDFLKVDHSLKEMATVVRVLGTSDVFFRGALGWTLRGYGAQPIVAGGSTGSEASETPDAHTLFRAGGVEVLQVKVLPKPNHVPPTDIKRLIRSPAEVMYYSGHGLSRTGMLLFDTDPQMCPQHGPLGPWLGAADLTPVWKSPIDLQVLIIAGCSVLKIDFSTTPASGPGLAWAALLTSKGGPLEAMLGYQGRAPCDAPVGENIAKEMGERMAKGSTNYVQDWLEVNMSVRALNAAAMDAKGYWWIDTIAKIAFIKGPETIP